MYTKSRIESLRLLEVKIPQHAVRDQDAHLECKYELRGESLYAVKWYKDGHEFFRYIPKDNPPTQIFELPGVRVNVSFLEVFQSVVSIAESVVFEHNHQSFKA
ncbi:hypothetical protein RUM44_012114 [Polyplax serrata]|uniref:Ig-like domain-containing protein n=1 Tax=Polyplax serrata TaxID=468196 RepID=A0ABR1BCJ1_POLSC